MNDIAILCRNTRFCRMLELVLGASGYSVICNPRGGSARLWLVDLDTVSLPANHPERICLGISRDPIALEEGQRTLCSHILKRPFEIERLTQTVMALLSPDRVPLPAIPKQQHLQRTPLGFEMDGEPLSLTASEEQILDALYQRRGETVSRAELCALLENETNEKLADVYICLLRRKLETEGHPRLLFTVRGVGYCLKTEV